MSDFKLCATKVTSCHRYIRNTYRPNAAHFCRVFYDTSKWCQSWRYFNHHFRYTGWISPIQPCEYSECELDTISHLWKLIWRYLTAVYNVESEIILY